MKRFGLAFSLAFGLMGCGDVNVSDPEVNVNTDKASTADAVRWTEPQINYEKAVCGAELQNRVNKQSGANNTREQAYAYCGCIVDALSKSIDYAEFSGNVKAAVDSLGMQKIDECYAKMPAAPAPVVTTTETTTKTETVTTTAPKPAGTKIAKGMTKAEVKAVMGDPSKIEKDYRGLAWVWIEAHGKKKYCIEFYDMIDNDCRVIFDDDGEVAEAEDVDAKYLDVESF